MYIAGQATLIKMSASASSFAYCTVTALRNVLDGEYAPEIGPVEPSAAVWRASQPTVLDMLTILGEADRRSSGSSALVTRIAPIAIRN